MAFAAQTTVPTSKYIAQSLRNRVRVEVQAKGQQVTITRRPESSGATAATMTAYCLAIPQGADSNVLAIEGNGNLGEANPHEFIFEGGLDIKWATDIITYNGNDWRILNTNSKQIQSVEYAIHAWGVLQA